MPSPFIPFTPPGLCAEPFVLRRSGCVHYSHSFQWGARGPLRAGTDSVTHASRTSLSFCAVGWWGGSGKDAVSLLRDNGGLGSCLRHNKGTSLLLVLFTFLRGLRAACVSGRRRLDKKKKKLCVGFRIETFQPSASHGPVGFITAEREKIYCRRKLTWLYLYPRCAGPIFFNKGCCLRQ